MEPLSRDVTSSTFEQDVIEASRSLPVVVDFWAAWCAPCRVLKPILEKLAAEYAGRFVLAKVDTDKEPALAARFGIRSIPNVKVFLDGKVIDEFSGALPESHLRAFLDSVLPTRATLLRLAARRAREAGDLAAAESSLREALGVEPGDQQARVDLVEVLLAREAWPEAEQELAQIPDRERDERADQLASRIARWKRAQALGTAAELEEELRRQPDDLELRHRLAERCIVERRHEQALEHLLEVVRAGRGALRDSARKAMLEVFDLASDQPELVARYRRLLASALY